MHTIFTRSWALDAVERALKTAAQVTVALLGQNALDVFHADWMAIAGTAGGAFALSVLTSVLSAPAPGMSPASVAPPV